MISPPTMRRNDEPMKPTHSLGLALGGGGALGAAHLGVLQELAARHIRPDIVAGTSAGALVGAAYAAGIPLQTLESRLLVADWGAFGRLTLKPRLGLLDPSSLIDTITSFGGQPRIEDLPRRFAAVATDLRTRREVAITDGPLEEALRASIAVPGLFPPVRRGDQLLVDGGLAANLPIAAARQLGASTVIAVRLRPEWERLSIAPSAARIAELEAEPSTIMIRPDLRGMSQWSRTDVSRLISAGRVATAKALDRFEAGIAAVA